MVLPGELLLHQEGELGNGSKIGTGSPSQGILGGLGRVAVGARCVRGPGPVVVCENKASLLSAEDGL